MKVDVSREIRFTTARSGGKGGQNVNKVETMVAASLDINNSSLFTEEQKNLLHRKLANKINSEGLLQLKSQAYRSQLANKEDVTRKMQDLIEEALQKAKPRRATKPSYASKEQRLQSKKRESYIKQNRQKFRSNPD